MKILKPGTVIYFSCNGCGCSFVVGTNHIESNDGNWYVNCPCCGNRCHTDVAKQAEYKKKENEENE